MSAAVAAEKPAAGGAFCAPAPLSHEQLEAGTFPVCPAVGVAYCPEAAAEVRRKALACLSGVTALGGRAWDFGACVESQFEFCLGMSRADFGVYVGPGRELHITGWGGPPCQRAEEGETERALLNLPRLYPFELVKLCNAPLEGMSVTVEASSRAAKRLLEDVLARLGCRVGEGDALTIRLSPDGRSAALSGYGVRLSEGQVLAAVCAAEFLHGRSVALPRSAPLLVERLAARYGGRVLRYGEEACRLGAAQPWTRDGMMLALKLLSILAERWEGAGELPAEAGEKPMPFS